MRLQPEAVGIGGELDAQIGARQIDVERPRQRADGLRVLKRFGDRVADRVAGVVLRVEIGAARIVEFALARDVADALRGKRQIEQLLHRVAGEDVGEEPMPIRRGARLAMLQGREQARLDVLHRHSEPPIHTRFPSAVLKAPRPAVNTRSDGRLV